MWIVSISEAAKERIQVVRRGGEVEEGRRRGKQIPNIGVKLWHSWDWSWFGLRKGRCVSNTRPTARGETRIQWLTTNVDLRIPTGSLVCVTLIVSSMSTTHASVSKQQASRRGSSLTRDHSPALWLCKNGLHLK